MKAIIYLFFNSRGLFFTRSKCSSSCNLTLTVWSDYLTQQAQIPSYIQWASNERKHGEHDSLFLSANRQLITAPLECLHPGAVKCEHLPPSNWFPSVPNTVIIHSLHIYWALYVPGTVLAPWDISGYKDRKVSYPYLSGRGAGKWQFTYIINK